MLSNRNKYVFTKIISTLPLFILYLTMIYLSTIFVILLHSIDNIKIIAISFFVTVFVLLLQGKQKKHGKYEKYIGLRAIAAIFIDIITIVLFICLFGIISILLPVIFYNIFAVLLSSIILGYNVFFTSPGYRLLKINVCRYKIPVLFYNALFIFCFIGILRINKLPIYIIAGLYFGLDSLFIILKKTPLVFYIFKITYTKDGGAKVSDTAN